MKNKTLIVSYFLNTDLSIITQSHKERVCPVTLGWWIHKLLLTFERSHLFIQNKGGKINNTNNQQTKINQHHILNKSKCKPQ